MKSVTYCILLFSCLSCLCSCIVEPPPRSPTNYEDFLTGTEDKFPVFSPDGEYIAYYHNSSTLPEPVNYPSGLYIVDKMGNNRQLVIEGHHYDPSWSPNGEWLVFSTHGVIQKCKINGDSLSTVKNRVNETYWFPDYNTSGDKIIFDRMVNSEGSLLFLNSDFTSEPAVLLPNLITARDPEYSPNGDVLLYMKGSKEWNFWELHLYNFSNKNEIRLTTNDLDDRQPSWSPDGNSIVWSQQIILYKMKLDQLNPIRLTYGQYPTWSVSGKIAFSHASADYSQEVIYVINEDGTNKQQITF